MSAQLQIRTLGGLTFTGDDAPLSGFDSRKVQALLVYLACTGHAHPREVLAEMLWEDRPQAQSLANLRVALTSLRKTAGPFVHITRETVGLAEDATIHLDCATFEAQLQDAGTDAERLEAALAHYQGDFLAGFYVDSAAFEQWATRERERLRLRAMEALDTLITGHLDQGDYQAGIAAATRLLGMDPLREETHRQVMDLLWRSGQRGKALEQYETCRRVLQDELGVEPTPQTTALYDRIRAGEPLEEAAPGTIRSYAIRERIATGGFGEVYRAWQPVVEREVAIKVIRPEFANHPDFIRRFETEAQLVARLEHPHIVPLYDYWREPEGAYLVMRYLPGNLRTRLQQGPLTVSACVRLVEQIASALTVAHRHGVIHRDLKPANILLDEAGNAYLADFGIAKVLEPALRATQEGALVGSPAYLSPEQIRSEPVTPQSDLYSFGVLLYEVLTGQSPFPSDLTPSALLYKQLNEPLPALRDSHPDLPDTLDAVLQQATAKDPTQRYPDAVSLAAAFRMAAEGEFPAVIPAVLLDEETAHIVYEPRNPYKGLRAFTEADAGDFFGREALVEHLLTRLAEGADFARFLAVVGPSGCGKSSVVRAGLIPALREGRLPGADAWFIAQMLPSTHPLEEVEIALNRVTATPGLNLLPVLGEDERGLLRAIRMALPDDQSHLLLVVDQFEEIFTLVEDSAEARHFMDSLYAAVTEPRSPLRVIITLRADFYDRPLMHPHFSQLVRQRTEAIVPMTAEDIERAVSLPAEEVGVRLEPGLVAAITAEVHEQPGALPMLQYALTELFDRRQDHTLSLEAYQAVGGVQGALTRRADEVYEGLDAAQQQAARQLFLRLVTLGEGVEDTRRRTLQSELLAVGDATMPQVIDAFDRDPVTRGPTVEVAHEAILREWGRLRVWLDESRHDIRQQRLLAAATKEWQDAGQDPSYLLRGARLEQFEGWAAETDVALTPEEQRYLDVSLAEERRLRARRRRARNVLLAAATLVAVVMTILALVAFDREQQAQDARATSEANLARAEREAAVNHSLVLANEAEEVRSAGDTDLALALALEAVNIEDPPVDSVLALKAVALSPGPRAILTPHEDAIQALAFSPDGRLAASAGCTDLVSESVCACSEIILWDISGSASQVAEIARIKDLTGGIHTLVFLPNTPQLLTGGDDGKLLIWDIQPELPTFGMLQRDLAVYPAAVRALAVSPDGTQIALALDGRNELLVLETSTGENIHTLTGHNGQVNDVVFSPDGTQILSASDDTTMILWDATTGDALNTFEGHMAAVHTALFTPDGQTILSRSDDFSVRIWNVEDGAVIREHKTIIGRGCIGISPDGRLAYICEIGTATVWDLGQWSQVDNFTLTGTSGNHLLAVRPFGPAEYAQPGYRCQIHRRRHVAGWGDCRQSGWALAGHGHLWHGHIGVGHCQPQPVASLG